MEILLPTSGRRDHVACRSALLFLLIIGLLLTQPFAYAQPSWNQLGADIDGGTNDGLGGAMAMSSDGSIVAVGAASANSLQGYVKVYQYNGSWMQLGATLPGSQAGDSFGSSVSLSADGTVLAIGASTSDANLGANSFAGYVSVYDYDATNGWQLRGSSITAQDAQENFGQSVSLSSDGNVLGIGVPGAAGGGSGRGTSRAYKWNSTAWLQVGADIDGDTDFETSGVSVSLVVSGTDTVMAIGSPVYTLGFDNEGRVRIYTRSGGSWGTPEILVGSAFDNLGTSVSLSDDATRLGVGAPHDLFSPGPYIGKVQVYELTTSWTLLGTAITSGIESDDFGKSVDISSDGSYVTIGAPGHVDTDNPGGRVEIWTYGTDWTQVGDAITGSAEFSMLGTSVTISSDGSIAGAGSPANDGTTANGYASIYEFGIIATNTPPVITASQVFTVDENTSVGTGVSPGAVQATDANAGDELSSWTITGGTGANVFAINASTGIITVNSALDYETTTSYTLTLTVSDGTATSSPAEVIINIGDIDEVAPTVTITSSKSNPTNANPIPITITFNESVTGLEASDIDVDGAGKGDLMGSGDSYTMDLTPSGDGTITVNINANVAQDLANNGNTAAEQFSIISDRTNPQVFIYGAAPDFSELTAVNGPFDISVTFPGSASFGEVVNGFEIDDIELTNGATAGAPELVAGNFNYYRVSITPGTEDFTITILANGVTDDAGNGNQEGAVTISYDITPPTPVITSEASGLTNLATIPITVTFEEPGAVEDLVTQFVAEDITVVGATISNFAGEGSTYTMNLVPSANTNGTITVDIAADVAEDKAGNANLVAQQFTIDYDRTVPKPTITLGDYTNSKPIPASISLSEELDGFGSANISVTSASISNFTPGANNTYTFNLAIAAGTDSTKVTVSIAAAQFTDVAGNGNLAATASIIYDIRPPVPVITSQAYHSGTAFAGTVKINEQVVDFPRSDLTINGGSIGSLNDGAFQITPSEPYRDITIRLPAARFTDLAGNPNGAVEVKVIYDNTPPSVASMVSSAGTVTKDKAFQVTITFEEGDIRELQTSDLDLGNGEIRSFNKVDNKTYTLVIEAVAKGAVTVSIIETFTDLAGNRITNKGDLSVTYDPDPPTIVSLAFPDGQVTNKQSVRVVVAFSEEVVNVDGNNFFPIEREDVNLTSLTTEDNKVFTALITMANVGLFDLVFLPGSTMDLAGNALAEGEEFSITYELTPPTATIKNVPETISSRNPFKVTFEFSEVVTGFEAADITISTNNATVSNPQATSTSVFTADITPTGDLTDGAVVSIGLKAEAVQDEAGNGNLAAAEVSTTFDGPYSGGTGTEADPYLISTEADLRAISANTGNFGAYFLQTADIQMSGLAYKPIGFVQPNERDSESFTSRPFTGVYDGAGFKINGLRNVQAVIVDRVELGNLKFRPAMGLFGLTSNATLKNISLTSVNIGMPDNFGFVGALIGVESDRGTIKNCMATGYISNIRGRAGGLMGSGTYIIENSFADVTILAEFASGLSTGSNGFSEVYNSYVLGTFISSDGFSGLGGFITNGANSFFAGIVETNDDSPLGIGLASPNLGFFYDVELSGIAENNTLNYGRTTAQMYTRQTYVDAGWDFQNTWSHTFGYPRLKWQAERHNKPFTVSGYVVDENGEPFSEGVVFASKYPPYSSKSAEIDASGNFRIDLEKGEYQLGVAPKEGIPYEITYLSNTRNLFKSKPVFYDNIYEIKMIAKSQVNRLDGNGRVSGNIVGGTSGGRIVQGRTLDGDPVEGVSVTLLRVADEEVITSVETDENGYFEITGIPAGEYQLVLGVAGIDLNLEGSTFTVDEKGTPLVISAEIGEEGVSFTIVEVLGVEDQIDIAVYPNPVKDFLNIRVEGKATLRLIDLSGATVHEESFVNEAQLDVRTLVPGVHFLEIANSHGRSVRKLIKAN